MLLNGTSWSPDNLNPAYVASVDAMVMSAAKHGIYLFLDRLMPATPVNMRVHLFRKSIRAKKCASGANSGAIVTGTITHVNFVFGNDRLVAPQVDDIASGIMKYMPDG